MEDRLFASDAAVIRGLYAERIWTLPSPALFQRRRACDRVRVSAPWLGKDGGKAGVGNAQLMNTSPPLDFTAGRAGANALSNLNALVRH